jgi:hypothetical protein
MHVASDCIDYHFAWSHGDIQQEIANTWVGFVGPGDKQGGADSETWTDHTNVRPTILTLLGLKDDYLQDGRVLIEGLDLPSGRSARASRRPPRRPWPAGPLRTTVRTRRSRARSPA